MPIFSNIKISKAIFFFFFVFLFIGFFITGGTINSQIQSTFTASTFLFGIFVAFSIANSQSKLNKVNETLREDSAIWLFVYKTSDVFGPKVKKRTQELIDLYFIDQIDYFLEDFKYSNKSFFKLFDFLINLETENSRQEKVYGNILNSVEDSLKNRKLVETLLKEHVSKFEWISILSLLGVILFFIFNINNGSIISIISSILLATSAVTIVFVLRDLDSLHWKEQSWIWEKLENLFNELELLPYYPKEVLSSGRGRVEKGRQVRIAEYPNLYPDMSGKVVKIITT